MFKWPLIVAVSLVVQAAPVNQPAVEQGALPGKGLAQHPFLYCGKLLWSVDAPSAWAAVRLPNGHTLISGNQHGYVREVNSNGETVWEINQDDLPGIPLFTVQEVSRLANGNTLINNWAGSRPKSEWPNLVQLIEVTPAKKVVWALRDRDTLGPASSTQLLDEPGVPERGDQRR